MGRRRWILVEWVDDKNAYYASYGVVRASAVIGSHHSVDLYTGRIVCVRSKHMLRPRRAKILRISDDRNIVKDQKRLLESQHREVKSVLDVCIQAIRKIHPKTDYSSPTVSVHAALAGPSGARPVAASRNYTDSDSTDGTSETDSSSEAENNGARNRRVTNYAVPNNRLILPGRSNPRENRERRETADKQTQTDKSCKELLEYLDGMEKCVQELYRRFQAMTENAMNAQNESHIQSLSEAGSNTDREQAMELANGNANEEEKSDAEMKIDGHPSTSKALHVRRVSAQTTNNVEQINAGGSSDDMVSLGNGHATVPARLIREIDWNCHTAATRLILQAVFPRKVLATHCLSGRGSPAFANRPAKKQLDPKLVEDIVNTVSQRCGVPKRLVRSSITTKCTDEAKLYRNRRRKKLALVNQENQENAPPSPSHESTSSD